NLTGRGGLEYTTEPRAVQIHVWDDGYGLISHLSYIPAGYETVTGFTSLSEEAAAKWLAQNRREDENLCTRAYDGRTFGSRNEEHHPGDYRDLPDASAPCLCVNYRSSVRLGCRPAGGAGFSRAGA